MAYLAQPTRDPQPLVVQREQTDQRLAELRTAAKPALSNAPQSITTRWQALTDQLDQLPDLRTAVDARAAGGSRVYDFYNGILATATNLFDTQARIVPDVAASLGGITATDAFRVSDQMSRAGSTIDTAFSSRKLTEQGHLEFVALVGAYRAALTNVAPHLEPAARARYETITAGDPWKELVAAENALIATGAWDDGIPRGLPVNRTRWETITKQVSDELIDMAVIQADRASAEALRTGNNQLLTASLGSLLALAVAIAAILWALRQSRILVDQALSVRLGRLGQEAAAVVDERLPMMMARLRRREKVDLAVELPSRDYGSDEIGQVAEVINRSLRAAAAAAVDEAKTRAAGLAMLMGVARRPQRPLQRGLKVIEELQDRVGDEKLLTELFDINHQLTQTRRFLENLVILAGGQIGRRFHNPVPVRRVLLAAFAEAQQYQRITLRGAPDLALAGRAVAGTIHLLAELLDNALVFSPPKTTVWVTCNEVKHGVAVEIEDGGVGMNVEALESANELLATAPTPDVAALKDGAQVGLHVVAELAKRDGIQVSLRTSAYGGLLAIVLLPERLITAGPAGSGTDRTDPDLHLPVMAGAVPGRAGAGAGARMPRHGTDGQGGTVGIVTNGSSQPRRDRRTAETRRTDRVGETPGDRRTNGSAGTPQPPAHRADTAAAPPGTIDRPPLPSRQPQQHIAPELREDKNPATGTASSAAGAARSPEEARERFTRYQRAWAAGKTDGNDNTEESTSDEQGGKA
ncbi:nitrate- and nitrite sensing domain-containing protein [Plantactinospora sp. WMMB334]|uniref:sensor histidine kinase n=1 Tax=Plantactinospora sp. WMMB334 TaxID=3404119 RepID=UPI003B94796D